MSDHIIVSNEVLQGFTDLFMGFSTAYGTGRGGWVHSPPTDREFRAHLTGLGEGLGIGPLRPDGTVSFAAIDLDEPDFALAQEMMKLLPGVSWLERSRSGNAHVHVFFRHPIEAWIARGILREACAALGRRNVEIFPKTDRLLPGMVGNYLNLPYFGKTRPMIAWKDDEGIKTKPFLWNPASVEIPLNRFVAMALANTNTPETWRKRASWLGIPSPEERAKTNSATFGASPTLHMCGQYLLENRDENPVVEGHRASVYFAFSKMLANWSEIDDQEALEMLALVNDSSPDPISNQEIERIYRNAKRGEFTSTGCDDPLFEPYRHPDCKIGR